MLGLLMGVIVAFAPAQAPDTPYNDAVHWQTRSVIAQEFSDAGFGPEDQLRAIYVSCRESGLEPGHTSGSSDGVMQIHWRSWRKYARELGYTRSDLRNDAVAGARIAARVLQVGGWRQWRGGGDKDMTRPAKRCRYDWQQWQDYKNQTGDLYQLHVLMGIEAPVVIR